MLLTACAVIHGETVVRVALLAPFEGRYREVGYNALYAARLAMQDSQRQDVELLPIDDGGTVQSAVDRAHALADDPLVKIVLVMGYAPTDDQTQRALSGLPAVVIGEWGAKPANETVFILASPSLEKQITTPHDISVTDAATLTTPLVGGDVFALAQLPKLRPSLDGITIVSSASLPDDAFRERYLHSAQFVPEPGLLATLSYDATAMAVQSIHAADDSRTAVQQQLATLTYTGLNGTIKFEGGYWQNAPVYHYNYDKDRRLHKVQSTN